MLKHKTRNTLLNNLGIKQSLLTKFGQFMSYYKLKKVSKIFAKTAQWKLVPSPFVFPKNYAQPLLENEN